MQPLVVYVHSEKTRISILLITMFTSSLIIQPIYISICNTYILFLVFYRIMDSAQKNFTFTKNTNRLTLNQRIFYEANGYLVIPRLLSAALLDKCSQRYDDIVAGKVKRGMMTVMHDITDRKVVNKIQDINHDQVLNEYIECNTLLNIVEAFTGPNIIAVHNMLIAKPPDAGSNSSRFYIFFFLFKP